MPVLGHRLCVMDAMITETSCKRQYRSCQHERQRDGYFKDHGGAVPNRLHLQLLTKLRAVRVESAMSHGHARELQRCYAEQSSNDFASVLLCVFLCMPLSSQIDRKRKRSAGAAWNRTLEGSAFTECPICSRRASPVYLSVCALPCCGLNTAPCTA